MAVISPERFLTLRNRDGLTRDQLGKQLGVGAKYLGMIERGEKTVDDDSSLGLLFCVLENGGASQPDPTDTRPTTRMIPVVSWAHAGECVAYEELPESWREWVPTECRDKKAMGLVLEGDSMEGRFREGDLLVVMPSEEAYSGCFVVAKFRDDGVVFRRFEKTGSQIRLVPLNERYPIGEHDAEEFAWIWPVWGRWSQLWKR